MGCECLWDINHPHCPATTIQEVRDMLPKGCEAREISDRVETYCNVRNGKELCFKCKYAGIANEKYEYILLFNFTSHIQNYYCIHISTLGPNIHRLVTCLGYDGIPHKRFAVKPTCCNKECPLCGGNDCKIYTDTSGEKLGASQCCGIEILNQGNFCGSGGQKAPCKIQFTENDVLESFYHHVMFGVNF